MLYENHFLFGYDDRRSLRLPGQFWTRQDIQRVVSTLGITPLVLGGVLTKRDLADSHPYALRWPERRPVPFLLLLRILTIGISNGLAALVDVTLPS